MKQLEIPLNTEKGWRYRFFEKIPALISWTTLLLPIGLSFVSPTLAAYYVLLFMLAWLVKALGYAYRTNQGYQRLQRFMRVDWRELLRDMQHPKKVLSEAHTRGKSFDWHYDNLVKYASQEERLKPSDIHHVIIMPTYNEPPQVVEPTIQSLVNLNYDIKKRVMFVLAYEERGGKLKAEQSEMLAKRYASKFWHSEAIMHPEGMEHEVIGKGGNATYAGRWVAAFMKKQKIDPEKVVITTIDSDNRPHPHYLAAVTYEYVLNQDRLHTSFQPIPMFLNNIWDAPAPMRVLATGNSFWNLISSSRPHLMRNFSAHAQSLQTLIDTDFWSVRTIVEDGHQFWRTYFRYDGKHSVVPIYVPIYQDAVLEETYGKTLKAQFIQLRRWAYGASDVAYVMQKGYVLKNKVPKRDLFFKLMRLLESHVSWATAPLILAGAGWLPILLNPEGRDDVIAHQLPIIASRINTIIALGILVTVFLSMRMLPPRPPRYKAHKNIFMVLQWVLLPLSSIVYGSFAALYSQTRLLFGRYLDKFDVTTKAVKK